MAKSFEIGADSRKDQGKGASRRLRHAGKVPAILYGGKEKPQNITLDQRQLLTVIDNEKFYSLITLNLDGKPQTAIVKDVQMHPAKNIVVHLDLQRVFEDEPVRMYLPIHFLNAATCPGVKLQGGIVSHLMSDVEISCLPRHLPEALEVDMGQMKLNETIFLRDVQLPEGVTVPALVQGRNPPVVSIHAPRVEEAEPAAAEAAAAAATATPAAGAEKKDAGKK
jgi:large subunit ribosomal protein L25